MGAGGGDGHAAVAMADRPRLGMGLGLGLGRLPGASPVLAVFSTTAVCPVTAHLHSNKRLELQKPSSTPTQVSSVRTVWLR